MEGSGSPYLLWAFGTIIVVLILVIITLLWISKENLKKKVKQLSKGENLNEEEVQEEIISMVNEGHEQGVLLAAEAEMIQNIFEFGDKEAKDIMTHRKNVIAIDGDLSFHDALDVMIDNSKSRYPVYIDDVDNIIGVLHIKDVLRFAKHNEIFRTSIKDIKGLISDIDFIPETRNIHLLFNEMQLQKKHMVVVVDEYGQMSGIVAMEDILEEIVGNIEDEHDEESSFVEELQDGSYVLDGIMPLEEALEILDLNVDEDDFDTLNGFLISQLDKIPTDGEELTIVTPNYEFQVLQVENKTIRKVKAIKTELVNTEKE